jgi:Mg2+-importing ATPase
MESIISASAIVLVIRTRKPFFKSNPGKYLLIATLMIIGVTLISPFTPIAELFGFKPLPFSFFLVLALIVALYIIAAEVAKKVFYKRMKN